jgi:hypothetical protein
LREPTPQLREPQHPAARASWTNTRPSQRALQIFGAAGLVALFLAYAGAFGSGDLPVVQRYIYWIVLTEIGAAISLVAVPWVVSLPFLCNRPWLRAIGLSLTMSVIMTFVVMATGIVMLHQQFSWLLPLFLFPAVLMVTLAITAIVYLVQGYAPPQTHAGPEGSPPPKFLERIPVKLKGGDLYAVEAEDHYLRLHTSLGQDLILMRLSDAVSELEGLEGAQTHRSWWVAKDAVTGAERGDGRATLTLKDGSEVPVSRAYARTLRAEGWF